jgi:hypothetical protein
MASEFCRKIIEDCNRTGNIYLLHTYNGSYWDLSCLYKDLSSRPSSCSNIPADRWLNNFLTTKKNERRNFPSLAYCYANLSQIELAKSIIDRLDPTKIKILTIYSDYQWVQFRIAFLEADSNKAARHARDCLSSATQMHYQVGIFLGIECCAGALYLIKRHAESIQCLAAVHSSRLRSGAPVWTAEQPYHERLRWGLISAVGEAAFQEYWQAGECLSLEEAIELALSLEDFQN